MFFFVHEKHWFNVWCIEPDGDVEINLKLTACRWNAVFSLGGFNSLFVSGMLNKTSLAKHDPSVFSDGLVQAITPW